MTAKTLAALLARRCATCGHSFAEHVGAQVIGRFGGGDSGLDRGNDIRIVGCTVTGCKCRTPRFRY